MFYNFAGAYFESQIVCCKTNKIRKRLQKHVRFAILPQMDKSLNQNDRIKYCRINYHILYYHQFYQSFYFKKKIRRKALFKKKSLN